MCWGNCISSYNVQCLCFWGWYVVIVVFVNFECVVYKIWGMCEVIGKFELLLVIFIVYVDVVDLGWMVLYDVLYQGLVIEVVLFEDVWFGDLMDQGVDDCCLLLVFDLVIDLYNVGVVLCLAVVFNVLGIVIQDCYVLFELGVLVKLVLGVFEFVLWVCVVNLLCVFDEIGDVGFWWIGLVGEMCTMLVQVLGLQKVVLVLGVEGEGMCQNVVVYCDVFVCLLILLKVESFNVLNVVVIVFYVVGQQGVG